MHDNSDKVEEVLRKLKIIDKRTCGINCDIRDALINANDPNAANYFVTLHDLSNVGIGTNIFNAINYSALPNPTLNSGVYYWVENSQGTYWLPGFIGGTYYGKGLYYSNGTTWETAETPINATQAEVNLGLNDNKFVTPKTLETKLSTIIQDANYLHDQGVPSDTWVIAHNLGKYPSVSIIDTAGTDVLGKVEYVNINTIKIYFKNAFSGKASIN